VLIDANYKGKISIVKVLYYATKTNESVEALQGSQHYIISHLLVLGR